VIHAPVLYGWLVPKPSLTSSDVRRGKRNLLPRVQVPNRVHHQRKDTQPHQPAHHHELHEQPALDAAAAASG